MSKRFWLACFAAALLGGLLNFAYAVLPLPILGLFVPTNGSVWEHLKLLFFPTLWAGVWLSSVETEHQRLWGAILSANLSMPFVLLGLYYPMRAGFLLYSPFLNAVLYLFTMILGFLTAYHLYHRCKMERFTGVLVMFCGLYALTLVLFTFAAPNLPIFLAQ